MTEQKKSGGRPRDAEAAGTIKSATLNLLREHGYAKVTIAAIASEANVARQTLYNRWNTKADLVLDAIFEETGHYAAAPIDDPNLTCQLQLEQFLMQVFSHLSESGAPIRSLIAAAQDDDAFRDVFKTKFVKPREKMVTDLLKRAQSKGEIAQGRDVRMLSIFVHGAFWYALLGGDPVDNDLAKSIVDEVFHPAQT